MVVDRDYLLKKPSGPSAPKLFFDTRVVPLAANIAGDLEVALDRAAVRTGVRPALILAGATGLIGLGVLGLLRAMKNPPRGAAGSGAFEPERRS